MPYNPQIANRSDLYLAQSNQSAWSALATLLEGVSADAKKAKSLRAALSAYAPEGDEGKAYTAKIQTMGLGELEGEIQKHSIQQAMQEWQEKKQSADAAMAYHRAMTDKLTSEGVDESALQKVMRAAAPESIMSVPSATGVLPDMQVPTIGTPTPDSLQRSVAGYQGPGNPMAAPGYDRVLRAMEAKGENQSVMPIPAIVGGRNLIVNPKSGAFQDVTKTVPALALGQELKIPGGGRWVGNGTDTPHFVPDTDRTKSLTEQQANALQYSERMAYNNAILLGLEQNGYHPAAISTKLSNLGPNLINSSEFQQYEAAKKNWISAVLRKESGAAISKSEESGADMQYFPRMGDSPAVIKQKAALRKLAETNMRRAVGEIKDEKAAAGSSTTNQQRFDSEQEARAAGSKAGDVIELYDPATATYRKARLK